MHFLKFAHSTRGYQCVSTLLYKHNKSQKFRIKREFSVTQQVVFPPLYIIPKLFYWQWDTRCCRSRWDIFNRTWIFLLLHSHGFKIRMLRWIWFYICNVTIMWDNFKNHHLITTLLPPKICNHVLIGIEVTLIMRN